MAHDARNKRRVGTHFHAFEKECGPIKRRHGLSGRGITYLVLLTALYSADVHAQEADGWSHSENLTSARRYHPQGAPMLPSGLILCYGGVPAYEGTPPLLVVVR